MQLVAYLFVGIASQPRKGNYCIVEFKFIRAQQLFSSVTIYLK